MNTQPSASGPAQATPVQSPPKLVGAESRLVQLVPSVQIAPRHLSQDAQKTISNLPPRQPATADELKRVTEELQRRIYAVAPELQFSVDQDSGRTIIKVTDPATNELIRQIPAEEVLRLNKELDRLQGLLLNRKA